MQTLQLRDAKASLSAVVASAERGQPTIITRHGHPSAMVVPMEQGERLFPSVTPQSGGTPAGHPGSGRHQAQQSAVAQRGSVSAGFLLDTSVISRAGAGSGGAPGRRLRAVAASPRCPTVPACVAVAELAQGIGKLRRAGSVERADRLDLWLDQLITGWRPHPAARHFGARLSGRLSDQATAKGPSRFADVAIAAIAMQANHLLLTRNVKHFQPLGVACADPVKQAPSEWVI